MTKEEQRYKVVTTLSNGEVSHCIHPNYERAKQAAESEIRIWQNFQAVKLIKI